MVAKEPLFSFERVWFLDCFGHLLCYSHYRKTLLRLPFQGFHVDGFIASPFPLPSEMEVRWSSLEGHTTDMPLFILYRQHDGLITLRKKHTQDFITINPRSNMTGLTRGVNAWEKFSPITQDMLDGFIVLTDYNMSTIYSKDDHTIERLHFSLPSINHPCSALLGEEEIDYHKSLSTFSKIGRLPVGEKDTFSFIGYNSSKVYNFTIERLKETAF